MRAVSGISCVERNVVIRRDCQAVVTVRGIGYYIGLHIIIAFS
jgi:hypothetical protein